MGKRTIRVRRTFTPQFKQDAVHLVVEEGKSLTEVATHLGIARSLLQRWREQLTDTPTEGFPGRGRLAPQARRVRELEQKLREVTQERDILKKPWRTSRTTGSEVPVHGAVPRIRCRPTVPRPRRVAQRLLRLAPAAPQRAGPAEHDPGRPDPRRAPREPGHLRLAASLPRLAQRGVRHRQASRRPAYATGGPARPRSSTVPIHRHPPLARPARRAEPDRPQLHRRGPQPPLARGHHSGPDPRGLALPRDPPRCLLAADCGV